MALAEIKHDENFRLVLIAPATETTTAIDLFFEFLRLNDADIRREFDAIIMHISGHPVSWFSVPRALQKIKAKILWLHDEDDSTTPLKDVYRVKKQNHTNIEYVITKGLGHSRIYRDAEVGKRIVEFI